MTSGYDLSPRERNTPRIQTRYYLWSNDRLWRITDRLHRDLIAEKARLPQYANTKQKIVEIFYQKKAGTFVTLAVRGTAFAFDHQGKLDLADQADAISGVFVRPEVTKNVVNIQALLEGRKWAQEHTWLPTRNLIKEVETDLISKDIPTLQP